MILSTNDQYPRSNLEKLFCTAQDVFFTRFEELTILGKIYKNSLDIHKSDCPFQKASHFSFPMSTF